MTICECRDWLSDSDAGLHWLPVLAGAGRCALPGRYVGEMTEAVRKQIGRKWRRIRKVMEIAGLRKV